MLSRPWVTTLGALLLVLMVAFEADGLGATESVIRDVKGFDSVVFATSGELIVTQGDQEALQIVARPNRSAGHRDRGARQDALHWLGRASGPAFSLRPPVFRLSMKTVARLEALSSGTISVRDLHTGSLRIRISSSGGISINSLTADTLEARISSSGSFTAAGTVGVQDVVLSSSRQYRASGLASTTARIVASSSGSAILRVAESLEANVTSSGSVRYYGNPPGRRKSHELRPTRQARRLSPGNGNHGPSSSATAFGAVPDRS